MKLFNVKYDEAYEYVKAWREIIDPNEGFKLQLMKFERNKRSYKRNDSSGFIVPARKRTI